MTDTNTTPREFAAQTQMHHATRAKAAKLAETFAAEYPRLTIEPILGDEIEHDIYTHEGAGFRILLDMGFEDETLMETDKVPALSDVLETCAEMGEDPSAEMEEETRVSGSVVPEAYRVAYRTASTTGRSNGDWLAEQLALDTLNGDGVLIVDSFVAVLEANNVDMSGKWAQMRFTQSRGWQGRFRMNGRQVMEKMVAKSGVYMNALGEALTPDAAWLDSMRGKHAKWLAKEAKREAAAIAAIKESVEG